MTGSLGTKVQKFRYRGKVHGATELFLVSIINIEINVLINVLVRKHHVMLLMLLMLLMLVMLVMLLLLCVSIKSHFNFQLQITEDELKNCESNSTYKNHC